MPIFLTHWFNQGSGDSFPCLLEEYPDAQLGKFSTDQTGQTNPSHGQRVAVEVAGPPSVLAGLNADPRFPSYPSLSFSFSDFTAYQAALHSAADLALDVKAADGVLVDIQGKSYFLPATREERAYLSLVATELIAGLALSTAHMADTTVDGLPLLLPTKDHLSVGVSVQDFLKGYNTYSAGDTQIT